MSATFIDVWIPHMPCIGIHVFMKMIALWQLPEHAGTVCCTACCLGVDNMQFCYGNMNSNAENHDRPKRL